jgi:hypothetical protein
VAIVEAVRSKLMDFVLEIERENPGAGEAEIGTQPLPPERVSQIFHQVFNINGEGNNIATGSSDFTQSASYQVKKGDVQSLHSYLKSLGIWDDDCHELCDALKAEIRLKSGRMGPRVAGWIGKMVAKAASGLWDVSVRTAPELLTKAIFAYYGLG